MLRNRNLSGQQLLTIEEMATNLNKIIAGSLIEEQNSLPGNPQNAPQIRAKIAMLQNPNLAAEIIQGRFCSTDIVNSMNGRKIAIVAFFPLANMRIDASQAVQTVKLALTVLEDFMATPFQTNDVRIWYGFQTGSHGGGGTIFMEDQESYNARRIIFGTSMVPFEPCLLHELSHSYILHEGLNQFLEIYVFNLIHENSTNMKSWTYMRDYATWIGTKTGFAALLDIYKFIGNNAMANAYRTIYPLNPPYGQPLDAACKQAFVNQSPVALKARISRIVSKIIY